jgi:hypothetical protein
MTTTVDPATLDPAEDPAIDRRTRAFLREANRDSTPFWELPGDAPRDVVTALQEKTPVDLSGITVELHRLAADAQPITVCRSRRRTPRRAGSARTVARSASTGRGWPCPATASAATWPPP